MAAPTVVGSPSTFIGTTNAGTVSISIPKPTGILDGDYIVVFLRNQSSAAPSAPTSSGFDHLGTAFAPNDSLRVNSYYGRPVTTASSEPATYDFSITTSSGTNRCIAMAFIVRGVDLTDPVAGFFDSYGGNAVTGGKEVGSYAVADVPVLALFAAGSEFTANNDHAPLTFPAGYTEVGQATTSSNLTVSRTYVWVGALEVVASPTTAASITWGVPTSPVAQGIALRGGVEPPDPAGNGFPEHDGNGAETRLYYTTVDGPRTPADVIPVRRGFDSVADMLATPGFTWAHRGGSASYPEMSLFAYTQAVVRGYGVLEVSLARTSDGVWFGLHDQTTDRTSGGTFGNASDQTWAQIQTQQIVIGPGDPQPYMRWEEIVAAYGGTHILVIDPKYTAGTHQTEFLNMVLSDIGTDRAIIKFSGPGSGAAALSTTAQGLGFQTWGYFYASDASAAQGGDGDLQTWGPSWTLIGMEYGASQAIWDEALALGKPVIAHIIPNQTAYATAISKGANGVQVSGVAVVDPVSWWTQ